MEELSVFMASKARKISIMANKNIINEVFDKIAIAAREGKSSITLGETPTAVFQFLKDNGFEFECKRIIQTNFGEYIGAEWKVMW